MRLGALSTGCPVLPTLSRWSRCAPTTPTHTLAPTQPTPPCRAQYLEENAHLIEAILQNQNLGRLKECVHYQQQLQQNLIFLAVHADQHPELQPLTFRPRPVPPEAAAASADSAEATNGAEEDGSDAGDEADAPQANTRPYAEQPNAEQPNGDAGMDAEEEGDASIAGLLRARGVT